MKFNKRLLYYAAIILYGIMILLLLSKSDSLFGSDVDWLPQHSVFPEIFRQNFYESKQLVPNFIYNIGGGQNVFNFIYYGFLNPIVLFSYFLPFVEMTAYIEISCMVLYLLTGILGFVFLKGHFGEKMGFAGSVIFMTMGPMVYHFHHHIMFVWYLPFLLMGLIGLDRYFEKKKSGFFIISVFLLILTNYYFSVGSLICLFIYAIYRVLQDETIDLKSFFRKAFSIVYIFIIPVLLSAFVLFPTAYALVVNSRSFHVSNSLTSLIFPNYKEFFFGGYGTGLTGLMFISLIGNLSCKVKKKSDTFLNTVLLLVVIFPLFSFLLNGFLYARAKVLIPFVILFIYSLCTFVTNLKNGEVSIKSTCIKTVILVVYSAITNFQNIYICLIILVALPGIKLLGKKPKALLAATLALLLIAAIINNADETYVSKEHYSSLYISESRRLMKYTSEGYYRSNMSYKEHDNANRIYSDNYYGTSIYSSTSNRLYQDFYENDVGNEESYRNCFITSGATNELFYTFMGTRYMISSSDPGLYYEKVQEGENLNLYENVNAYPVIYTSKNKISSTEVNKTKFPYSTEYLMTHTVVDGNFSSDYETVITQADVPSSYTFVLENSDEYVIDLGEEYKNKIVYLTFEVNNDGEYLNSKDIAISINGAKNKLTKYDWQYYNGNTIFDYVISLENKTELDIDITAGKYDIRNLKMYSSDMLINEYAPADDIKINKYSDEISCNTDAVKGDYLVTSIPYDKGFKAFINGKETKVEIVNKAFVGFPLEEGYNDIVIRYEAPFFKIGVLVSLFGLILLVFELLKKQIFRFIKLHREISMYLIFGVLTTVVSIASYAVCTNLFLNADNAVHLQVANVISWIVSVTFAYVTNKIWVFKSHNSIISEMMKFYSSRVGTLLIEMFLMYLSVTLAGANDFASKIFVQFVVIVSNYILSKLVVFKNNR